MMWQNWTRKQFESLPTSFYFDEQWWKSLLFFPTRKLHDSGYTYFAIVGVTDQGPQARIAEFDVFNLYDDARWLNIDCLYPSGVFRIFSPEGDVYYSYGRIRVRGQDRADTRP